jgi:hypothetical protein
MLPRIAYLFFLRALMHPESAQQVRRPDRR